MIRLAINGYGRIGRCVARALYESNFREHMQLVAINEPANLETIAHLTQYDSTHGRFPARVEVVGKTLQINDDSIAVSHQSELNNLPWRQHQVDVVLECSGRFEKPTELNQHIEQGAAKVLLSQPGAAELKTIVYGINQQLLHAEDLVISAASCTSNCIVPVIDVLHRAFKVESGVITTIHSAMNDQPVIDAYHHTDLRKTRAAGLSIIPVDTNLAAGVGRILPELEGKFSARALRVPTTNVSAMELSLNVAADISVEKVNGVLREAIADHLQGLFVVSDEPLASCDFNHDAHSGIIDSGQTRTSGQLLSVLVWFDNEWAYANRMLDIVARWYNEN